jgi:predicted glycoside hydrolase/deacetylase ChbG (UPF0249 family)
MHWARRSGFRLADRLISPGPLSDVDKYQREFWMHLLRSLAEGTNEVYCHPAYPDDVLERYATYVEERRTKLEIFRYFGLDAH